VTLIVDKAYLLITTRCNDSCPYCIIRKTDEEMSPETIEDGLRLIFDTPGAEKKVALYGGEPLVRFELARIVVDSARRLAREANKSCQLYLYTNGLAINDEVLDFLADNDIAVIQSLDVRQDLRAQAEQTRHHRETFPRKAGKLREVVARLGADRVCGAAVVLPEDVDQLMAVARTLIERLELRVIKLLPGLGRYHWDDVALRALDSQLNQLGDYIEKRRVDGRPIYVDLVNESIARRLETRPAGSTAVSVLEIYPNRRVGMSPCEFELPVAIANLNDTDRYTLGSLDDLDTARLEQGVQRLAHEPRHSGLRRLSVWAEATARDLAVRAESDLQVRQYVRHAQRLLFA